MNSDPPDWKEEAFARFLESEARQKALTQQRRSEREEFTIELDGAEDEMPANGPAFQEALGLFGASLRSAGIPYSQTAITFDSADGGGYPLPEFIASLKVLGPASMGALGVVLGAWVQGRNGRKARLKIGDTEAEARTIKEVEALLDLAKKHRPNADVDGE